MYLRSHTVAQPIQNCLWNFYCNIQLLSHIFDPSSMNWDAYEYQNHTILPTPWRP
jgi:hypothetical protein